MKILQAHNKYRQPGGEDIVCEQEYHLLSQNGMEVEQYIVDNTEALDGIWPQIKLLFQTHYSARSKKNVDELIEKHGIDLMHVHNFFPLLTPSIFEASKERGIPSVLTLHNYRLIHPNGLLTQKGEIDERSVKGSAYECVLDGVYRNSILQTLVVAHMIEYHRKHGTWNNFVDRFIVLSEFARKKFIEGGIPGNKIVVKPNFVQDPAGSESKLHQKENYFMFIGRIGREKGIEMLVEMYEKFDVPNKLFIFGEGPLLEPLKEKTQNLENIIWKGHTSREEVFHFLRNAKALLFPSICYEGFPMTIVEAFSLGTPVIASDIGSHAEIIKDQKTGLHFKAGSPDDLYAKIDMVNKNQELVQLLSRNARKEYETNYTPAKNLEQLTGIYKELCT